MTPAGVIATLSQIGRELGVQADEVEQLDREHVQLKGAYKREWARAFLTAQGSNDVRRAIADDTTSDLALEADLAEQVLRAAKEGLRVLRDRLEIGRSLGAVMRMEWAGQA